MSGFLRVLVVVLLVVVSCVNCDAHVVINNFARGGESLNTVSRGDRAGKIRATGYVANHKREGHSTKPNFDYQPKAQGNTRGKGLSQPADRMPFRLFSPKKSRGKPKSGVINSNGKSPRKSGRKDFTQSVVVVKKPFEAGSRGASSTSMDLTKFKPRGPRRGAPKGSNGGGGGAPGGGDAIVEGPDGEGVGGAAAGAGHPGHGGGPGGKVSGTPEPTAFLIWAIAGCCGYGFFRFRDRVPQLG